MTYSVRASIRAKTIAIAITLVCCLAPALTTLAQTNYYRANGTEYPVIGNLPGDQVHPDLAISTTGGYMVWDDNITDGDNLGISARRVDGTLSGALGTFRVNSIGAGVQENPRVALLKNGGAVFVWQGGALGYQHIYARFLTSSNTFTSGSDVLVNTFTNNYQITPAVAVLNNSNVVVVWTSDREAGSNSMQDVYGQILSPTGVKIGGEFLVNQFTSFNQRSAAVAATPSGGFIVTWVSEQENAQAPNWGANTTYTSASGSATPSVDVYARSYNSSGTPLGNEFQVNTDETKPCSNPTIAVATDGSCLIAWAAHDMVNANNGWDIYGRSFNSSGTGGTVFVINTHLYGDQYLPRASSLALDYLVTWTSMGQDGSREGVFARYVHSGGSLTGGEFQVNTTTLGQQMHPAVASDGANQFLVVWTSFTGLVNGFDLYAQRYINVNAVLQAMSPPYVWAPFVVVSNKYQPLLEVTWSPVQGISVSNYDVYLDGATTPTATVTSNGWTMTSAYGLTASSTHSFQVDLVTTDGRRSPISASSSGTTWQGGNWGGIPDEWMEQYYGYDATQWPPPNSKLGNSNMTLLKIFESGGDPLDPTTWLKVQLTKTGQGMFLSWNTQPGATYQVMVSTDFKTWTGFGTPRFAAGTTDSIFVGGSPVGMYQVQLMR